MKAYKIIFAILLATLTLYSCNDKIEESYTVNEPVYMTYEDLRTAVKVESQQPIIQPGKIYFKDNFILVNEYLKGIHVVDNNDPTNPQVLKFIEIPGNVDLAIRDNVLYVDSYVDLVALDISDIDNITEVKRIEDAFEYIVPEVQDGYVENVNQTEGVVVGYTQKTVTEEVKKNEQNFPVFQRWEVDMVFSSNSTSAAPSKSGTGTGGSMARFTISNNYLYTVGEWQMRLFNISNPINPEFEKEEYIGRRVETIFPYDDKLFIGSQTGMFIFSLADPANPKEISSYMHITACDPVVVEGNYAYVTLRSGNLCGAGESQLDVIDISNIQAPTLVKQYAMEEPYGLGIDNNVLFVCDGDAGLKIYDATDAMNIDSNMLAYYPEINTFDVIPLGNILLMIGIDGLYQYDYSNLDSIYELSYIPIYNN